MSNENDELGCFDAVFILGCALFIVWAVVAFTNDYSKLKKEIKELTEWKQQMER